MGDLPKMISLLGVLRCAHCYSLISLIFTVNRRTFEQKRKLHYNEFQAVKLAKQLMEEEEDEDDEEDGDKNKLKLQTGSIDSVESETSGLKSVSVSDVK